MTRKPKPPDWHINGHFRPLVVSVSVIGCLSVLAVTVICVTVDDVDRVTTYATLITTFSAMLITAVLSIGGTLRQLTQQTNSRMDQLIETTKIIAFAAGELAEKKREEAK